MAAENLPILVADFEAARRKNAAEMLELHAIYNRHYNESDAENSVAVIENDSIVYLEGMTLFTPDEGLLLIDDMMEIGRYKRANGKDETYYELKRDCIGYIDDYLERGRDLEGYDPYTATKYKLLMEKDCEVIQADYRHVADPEFPEQSDLLVEKMKSIVGEFQHDIFRSVTEDSHIETHIAQLEETAAREHEMHDMREQIAVCRVLDDIATLIDNPAAFNRAPRVESGKVKAYLSYGSAHMHSMTKKIT